MKKSEIAASIEVLAEMSNYLFRFKIIYLDFSSNRMKKIEIAKHYFGSLGKCFLIYV